MPDATWPLGGATQGPGERRDDSIQAPLVGSVPGPISEECQPTLAPGSYPDGACPLFLFRFLELVGTQRCQHFLQGRWYSYSRRDDILQGR